MANSNSYKSYQEAKIANRNESILLMEDGSIRTGKWIDSNNFGAQSFEVMSPIDHLVPVVDFLSFGNKFIDGDLYVNSAGRVFEVSEKSKNPAHLCNDQRAFDDETCVLLSTNPENTEVKRINVNAKFAQIPWTDGSIDEQEFAWSNGDKCSFDDRYGIFIGLSKNKRLAIVEIDNEFINHDIDIVRVAELSKPETEAEKKTRELAEEVNRICFDLFGTPAFDCNQDVIDTVEKFIINGYKKVD